MNFQWFRLSALALALWFTCGGDPIALADAPKSKDAKTHRLAQKDKNAAKQKAGKRGKNNDGKNSDGEDKKSDTADNVPVKKNSSDNRQGKKGVVLAEIGLIDVVHFGSGIQVGYFLTPRLMLEADYMQASFSLFGYESKVNVATARTKWFVGNSFYVQGGAGLRQLSAVDDVSAFIGTDSYRTSFASSYLVGEVGIGNRWQFDSFTIGCDWVGYLVPLAKLSSSESFSGNESEATKDDDRKNFTSQSENGNLLLVRFHLGWAF